MVQQSAVVSVSVEVKKQFLSRYATVERRQRLAHLTITLMMMLTTSLLAEPGTIDEVYLSTIRSVKVTGDLTKDNLPMMSLKGGSLRLVFDELANDARYLRYKLQYCNRDWTPSELPDFEYLDGFNDEQVLQFSFSVIARVPYVNYQIRFPNQNTKCKLSGNWLIHVYDESSGEYLLTRRFLVVDNTMRLSAQMIRPADVARVNTHHEIEFSLHHKSIRPNNPRQEVRAVVLQNGRWDTGCADLEPLNVMPEQLDFNYRNRIVFSAGREFRKVDIRNLRFPALDVLEIKEYSDAVEVRMKRDQKRTYMHHTTDFDLNGAFIIDVTDRTEADIQAEYVHVLFQLESAQPIHDHSVYLLGAFTDWQLQEQYKLEYEDRYEAYIGEAILKQGVYDYMYAAKHHATGEIDFELLEGSWHETDNAYTILIYYRPFGSRHDQIVAYTTLSRN